MTSARVTLTAFELAVFDGAAKNCHQTNSLSQFVQCRDVSVRDWWGPWGVTDNIPSAMRNGKTVVTNFTKRVIFFFFFCYCVGPHYRTLPHNRRILTTTMYGHFAVYESLNSCTRAHFCCGLLEVGSPISAFRFSPSHILKIRRHLVIFHAIIINNIVNTGYGA